MNALARNGQQRRRHERGREPRQQQDLAMPHSDEAEESVLGGILVHAAKFPAVHALLAPEHFYHPTRHAIYEAMIDLAELDRPIDALTVLEQMREHETVDRLRAFNGPDYLTDLMVKVVTVENIEYHARVVRAKASARSIVHAAREIAAKGQGEYGDLDEYLQFAQVTLQSAATQRLIAGPRWRAAADRALTIGGAGQKLPTGFPKLDEACRGGPRTCKVMVLGGAPGAGKTTWAIQLAWRWACQGVHVLVLAADEDANGLLIRIGQLEGLSREDLEDGDRYARQALARRLTETPTFDLVDAEESHLTVDEASEELRKRAGGKASVLVVDSIQTVRAIGTDQADSPRARIDAVINALKKASDYHMVLATSELGRGAYRSQNAAERIDDLAAFKESGGIEYGVTTALVLRSVPAEGETPPGIVDVTMPKNRQGSKLPFRLRQDFRTASFEEIEKDEPENTDENVGPTQVQQAKDRALEIVRKTIEPIDSKNELIRRVKKKRRVVALAIDELLEEGKLQVHGGRFHAAPESESEVRT